MEPFHFSSLFTDLTLGVFNETLKTTINNEDTETGLMIYFAIVYCAEPVALTQFLHSLLSTQSPRTIIQATVNTIQSDRIQEKSNRQRMNKFFHALNKIFDFKLGAVLLATTTPAEINSMLSKDWPYFTQFSKEIDQCINAASCQGVKEIVQKLGNNKI